MADEFEHPGHSLRDELLKLGLSAQSFASLIEVPTNRITQIMNGQRSFTCDTALRVGWFLQIHPEVWMDMQSRFDLQSAKELSREAIMALPTVKDFEAEREVG